VLEQMNQGQEEVKEATREILDIMRSAGDRRSMSGSQPYEIMEQINKSMTLIRTCWKELNDLCRKKWAMNSDTASEYQSLSRLKSL
jgi:hypothetical protein